MVPGVAIVTPCFKASPERGQSGLHIRQVVLWQPVGIAIVVPAAGILAGQWRLPMSIPTAPFVA